MRGPEGGVRGGSRWGSLINSLIGENGRGGPEGSTLNPGRILGRILSPRDVFSRPGPANWLVKITASTPNTPEAPSTTRSRPPPPHTDMPPGHTPRRPSSKRHLE